MKSSKLMVTNVTKCSKHGKTVIYSKWLYCRGDVIVSYVTGLFSDLVMSITINKTKDARMYLKLQQFKNHRAKQASCF